MIKVIRKVKLGNGMKSIGGRMLNVGLWSWVTSQIKATFEPELKGGAGREPCGYLREVFRN